MQDLATGRIARVRSRQYLIEDVVFPPEPHQDTLVRLSCLEDDAQGEPLEVLWEREVDAQVIGDSSWESITRRGFDDPRRFSAYLHTLKWNCVTSTNPRLFQAPYRAGIEVKAYQLEPLRKALLLPRVNLFIADDVGLGKTIEAGLILRELLIRQKVRQVVVACPPSLVLQWRDEMESRFGLTFMVMDMEFVAARRRERGYGVNPWTTHSRFIISHALLRDDAYAGPLRDWLKDFAQGALLILDEAHNAAPASGAKYAIASQFTKAIRDLAPRFEHKLFLSATPHNGHSNSFSSLLEILDPQRFCRGVKVNPTLLDEVMVRRLKSDLRAFEEDFPLRHVVPFTIDHLPDDAPELLLSRLLQNYRALREEKLLGASRSVQNAAMLVVTSLQKRLLSSVEAFARTLQVHRKAMARHGGPAVPPPRDTGHLSLLLEAPGADDDRAALAEDDVLAEEDAQVEAATARATLPGQADLSRELALLDRMASIANTARHQRDPKVQRLVDWIRQNLCPDLPQPGQPANGAKWLDRRLLIFTEYTDTKRYLVEQLTAAIAGTDRAGARIATFHGGMGEDSREDVKAAFNMDPARHPLRILVATDAAREGVNLQNHCADLVHFDVPWNPNRMEQRNGRIDRKLQRAKEVRCHYFVMPQRVEDRVLSVLVRKTDTIQRELGNLPPVIDRRLGWLLQQGIRHDAADGLTKAIDGVDQEDADAVAGIRLVREELEGSTRQDRQKLEKQLTELRGLLKASESWLGLSDEHFLDALSCSLELLGAPALAPLNGGAVAADPGTSRFVLPPLDRLPGADPTWADTMDSLRVPRRRNQKPWEWRAEAPVRPIVFRDPRSLDGEVVHLHLEHRIVQRLLGRFLAQGFVHDDMSRACVCGSDDPIPRVLAIGRLSLYGERASRLHDEVITVAAEWSSVDERGRKRLRPLPEGQKDEVLRLLEEALATPRMRQVGDVARQRLAASAPQDVADMIPHLQGRAAVLKDRAEKALRIRGEQEAKAMVGILTDQERRIEEQIEKVNKHGIQLMLDFGEDAKRQLEADRRYWPKRLEQLKGELQSEPDRIRAAYQVKAFRVEPVGLVYLWPVSG